MGSNMAEAHPVGFRWPMKAKEKGATLIHVDPRFSRTSALCDVFVGIRAGSDIAFLGGLINYVLTHERWFKEYVLAYTNASTIIQEGFQDTEDLGGLFSGLRPGERRPTTPPKGTGATRAPSSDGESGPKRRIEARRSKGEHGSSRLRPDGRGDRRTAHPRADMTDAPAGEPPRDPTLQHPRCVLQILRRHFARYTPEVVAEVCGCTPEELLRVAELLCDNSGRERTSGDRLRRRLDAAHHRRADHPRGRHPATAARQHRPARRRHHGDARPFQHPGLDRRPDALRPAARLPAPAGRRRGARDARRLRRARGAADRLLGQLPQVHRQPAQGVVRRRRHAGERLTASTGCRASTATIRNCRPSTAWPAAR